MYICTKGKQFDCLRLHEENKFQMDGERVQSACATELETCLNTQNDSISSLVYSHA